jgi:hypothetical protein
MNVWYLRSNLGSAEDRDVAGLDGIFAHLPRVAEWESRMRAVGHGRREEMSAEEALAIAAKASPETLAGDDPNDPNGRKVGDRVAVVPDDYGKVEVFGEIPVGAAHHDPARRRAGRGDRGAFSPRGVPRPFGLKAGRGLPRSMAFRTAIICRCAHDCGHRAKFNISPV